MQIPVGNFGNVIPNAAPRVNIPAGAFDTTSGIKELAQTGEKIASNVLEARAISEATTQIQSGKLDMDDYLRDLEENPVDEKGKPRFDEAVKLFQEKASARILRGREESKSGLAKELIQKDLGNYSVEMTRKVYDLSRKQEVDHYRARGLENLNLAVKAGDEKQVGVVLTGMARTGVMKDEDAVKEREKALKQIKYGRKSNMIQVAQTKEQLYEVRGMLSAYDADLSPEDNARLYDQVNQRIDRYDKEAEQVLKGSQDKAMQELTDLSIKGELTADVVLSRSDTLSKSDRNILAGLVREQERNGRDDPDTVRRLQIGVLTGTVSEAQLTKIASGYNPANGTQGDAKISPQTYRQLMGDMRAIRDDRFKITERKYETEDYKAAREFLRLRVPKKTTGSGLFDSFMLDGEDSERLAMALSALHQRAGEGKADHTKWAQDYLAQVLAKEPKPDKPIPRTPSSGPITGLRPQATNPMQIPPHVQKARDDLRVRVLRTELASERANLAIAKTPTERRNSEQNIRFIGQELRNLGIKP